MTPYAAAPWRRPRIGVRRTLRPAAGFTLLEVLVALAILAVTLAAASRAAGMSITNSGDLRNRLLATWVAENRIATHLAAQDWMAVGEYSGEEVQGGVQFNWRERVGGTPNVRFRRVEVEVSRADNPAYVLVRRVGFIVLKTN